MLLVANSTPMVDFDSRLNSLRVKRDRRLDLPTPESPISTTRGREGRGRKGRGRGRRRGRGEGGKGEDGGGGEGGEREEGERKGEWDEV